MKYLLPLFLSFTFFTAAGQKLVSVTELSTTPAGQLRVLSDSAKYNVKYYKITYNTTNIDGSTTIASGGLAIPITSKCDFFPLLAYDHGTVLEREDVPSRENFESIIPKLMASTGKVAVAPDYLGLGDNAGLHPYVHAESQATATIDIIRAAREFIEDSLMSVNLNGEVFVTGYSQGGHAAMATAKYIQDNSLFSEFNLVAAGPGSGPYNMSGSQSKSILSNQPYSNPGYICYLLFAYQRVYGNLYSSYSAILKSPYDQTIPPYFDGTYPMDSVNAQLPNKVSDFIQDTVLSNFKNDSVGKTHPLWQALLDNDNYDWNPSIPMELYYCTQDEQVDFQNSLDAAIAMQANGANVTAVNKGALTHGGCAFPALTEALYFYNKNSSGCTESVGLSANQAKVIEIYPNPATDRITIEGLDEKVTYKIFNINGQEIGEGAISANGSISISSLAPGIYWISLSGRNLIVKTRFLVKP